jgi:hypothetical protein
MAASQTDIQTDGPSGCMGCGGISSGKGSPGRCSVCASDRSTGFTGTLLGMCDRRVDKQRARATRAAKVTVFVVYFLCRQAEIKQTDGLTDSHTNAMRR